MEDFVNLAKVGTMRLKFEKGTHPPWSNELVRICFHNSNEKTSMIGWNLPNSVTEDLTGWRTRGTKKQLRVGLAHITSIILRTYFWEEFTYLTFTYMTGASYRRRFRSLLKCSSDFTPALMNSLRLWSHIVSRSRSSSTGCLWNDEEQRAVCTTSSESDVNHD